MAFRVCLYFKFFLKNFFITLYKNNTTMANSNLTKEIYEKHLKDLRDEAQAMVDFQKDGSEELTINQKIRLAEIYGLLNTVHEKQLAVSNMHRIDSRIIRYFEYFNIDFSEPEIIESE